MKKLALCIAIIGLMASAAQAMPLGMSGPLGAGAVNHPSLILKSPEAYNLNMNHPQAGTSLASSPCIGGNCPPAN